MVSLSGDPPSGWAERPRSLEVVDLHEGSDCGPVLVESPTVDTQPNCDRDNYVLSDSYAAFLDGKEFLWLLQDAHDPSDSAWAHNRFAEVLIPAGATAILHCFVPSCAFNDAAGHCTTDQQLPNAIDPLGGWASVLGTDALPVTYAESNGIVRQQFTKSVVDSEYTLYHYVSNGWGYLYMIELTS